MNFEIIIETESPLTGKIKFKGSKRGTFTVDDKGSVNYNLGVKTARDELDDMFDNDTDKETFFADMIDSAVRDMWIERAKKNGWTLAINHDGSAVFFDGKPTPETVEKIKKTGDYAEVIEYV